MKLKNAASGGGRRKEQTKKKRENVRKPIGARSVHSTGRQKTSTWTFSVRSTYPFQSIRPPWSGHEPCPHSKSCADRVSEAAEVALIPRETRNFQLFSFNLKRKREKLEPTGQFPWQSRILAVAVVARNGVLVGGRHRSGFDGRADRDGHQIAGSPDGIHHRFMRRLSQIFPINLSDTKTQPKTDEMSTFCNAASHRM